MIVTTKNAVLAPIAMITVTALNVVNVVNVVSAVNAVNAVSAVNVAKTAAANTAETESVMTTSSGKTSFPAQPPPQAPSIGGMLGTVALAVGIGVLGAYMLDLHTHTCEACGQRWRHLGAFNVGDSASHTCKSCGTVQWWKDGVPHVFRSVLFQPPPKMLPVSAAGKLLAIREAPSLSASASTAMSRLREVLR